MTKRVKRTHERHMPSSAFLTDETMPVGDVAFA